MAEYTLVNLKELEDQAPKFGLSPGVEARFGRKPLGLQKSGLSYQRLAPNFRFPYGHKHREQEEVYVILAGSARVKLEEEIVELAAWDALRVPGETMRGIEAGPDGVEFIAFGAPNVAPHDSGAGNDLEVTPEWWTD